MQRTTWQQGHQIFRIVVGIATSSLTMMHHATAQDAVYDYTGSIYTSTSCIVGSASATPCSNAGVYSPLLSSLPADPYAGDHLTASIVLSSSLPAGLNLATEPVLFYTISDGIDTISGPGTNVGGSSYKGAALFSTNASGQITAAVLTANQNAYSLIDPAFPEITLQIDDNNGGITNDGGTVAQYLAIVSNAYVEVNQFSSSIPGTWNETGGVEIAPGSAPGPTQNQKTAQQLKAYTFYALAATFSILAGLASGPFAIFIGGSLLILEGYFGQLGYNVQNTFDPPDYNYRSVITPSFPSLPTLPSSTSSCSAAASPIFNDLLLNASQIMGFDNAAQTSFNRATGAYLSNSSTFEQLQLDAANGFLFSANNAENNIARDVNDLSTSLVTCFPDPVITASIVETFEQQIEANGLPSSELSVLQDLGDSSSDISAITTTLESIDPNSIVGTYPADFSVFANKLNAADTAAVPEPSSVSLLLSSMFGLWLLRRRSSSKSSRQTECSKRVNKQESYCDTQHYSEFRPRYR